MNIKKQFEIFMSVFKFDRRKRTKFVRTAKKVLMAITIIGFVTPLSVYARAEAESPIGISDNLKLNTAVVEAVSLQSASNSISITPGESNTAKRMRLKREAAAKKAASKAIYTVYVSPTPSNLKAIYVAAEKRFGTPWELISAVHFVESGRSGSTSRCSYVGACGPMQFMPATWNAYGIDGNGDGISDIKNLYDAIYGGANYLAANGASSGNYTNALYRYNHSSAYVNKVLGIARSLGL